MILDARAMRSTLPAILSVLSLSLTTFAQRPATPDTLIANAHYLRVLPNTQAALQKNPNDVQALIQQSVLDWAFFRFDDAIATAERAVALADKSPEAHTQLTNALGAKLVSSTAGTFEKMSLARRFRKEADLSLTLDPNSLDALEDSARFYWNAPSIVGGDRSHAQQLADRVSHLDPPRGAALKAGFLVDEKDKATQTAAIESLWKAAVAASPQSADAHAGLSAAYFEEGSSKYALAESEARRAIALAPSRITAYRQLAILYAATGSWDELENLLKQAQAAVPDNLSPGYQAAKIILTSNSAAQLAHAERYLRAYLAQPAEGEEPSHAAAHWHLGLILEREGRRSDAIQELKDAIREDSSLDGAKKDLKRLS
jgi:tetratricopeptide (TPR) repeat protein